MTVIFIYDFKRTLHLNPINNNMCGVQFPDAYLNYVRVQFFPSVQNQVMCQFLHKWSKSWGPTYPLIVLQGEVMQVKNVSTLIFLATWSKRPNQFCISMCHLHHRCSNTNLFPPWSPFPGVLLLGWCQWKIRVGPYKTVEGVILAFFEGICTHSDTDSTSMRDCPLNGCSCVINLTAGCQATHLLTWTTLIQVNKSLRHWPCTTAASVSCR